MSIGEVADKTGLSVHALRYFEREELFVRPIERDTAGKRVYRRDDVEWILLCNRLRESGMSIARLREFAELVKAGPGNEPDRLALLEAHRSEVRQRLEHLQGCLDVIDTKVSIYQRHVDEGTAVGVWSQSLDPHR
ncbi:MerR family transcriptional regulator [Williamsia sp. M5A3_1d]